MARNPYDYDEKDDRCDRCGRDMVWHEGAYSGWVHSSDHAENRRLTDECQASPNPRR